MEGVVLKRKLIKWEKFQIDLEDDEEFGGVGPLVFSPMGAIPLLPPNSMNMWIGNCNFTIDDEVINKIKVIDGVETLEPLTRYRFRVGIAKQFNDKRILLKINKSVCGITYSLSAKQIESDIINFMLRDHASREWIVGEEDGVLYITDLANRGNLKILAANLNNEQ